MILFVVVVFNDSCMYAKYLFIVLIFIFLFVLCIAILYSAVRSFFLFFVFCFFVFVLLFYSLSRGIALYIKKELLLLLGQSAGLFDKMWVLKAGPSYCDLSAWRMWVLRPPIQLMTEDSYEYLG